MATFRTLCLAAWAAFLVACNGVGGRDADPVVGASVSPELLRVDGEASFAPFPASAGQAAYAWSSDMAIHSLRAPVVRISLTREDGPPGVVYACANADADDPDQCLVELADVDALENLLTSGVVGTGGTLDLLSPGTYDAVLVDTCRSTGWNAYLTGEVPLDGTTYYTDADSASGMSTTGPAEEVAVPFTGCGTTYPLPIPVTLAASDEVVLKLYFDLRSIARGALGDGSTASAWVPGGCTGVSGNGGAFACLGYPNIAGTIDDGTPVVEHYVLNDIATFGIYFTSGGDYFGGYTRRTYVHGDDRSGVDSINADTPLRTFSDNGNGTYTIENYSSADNYDFHSEDFRRLAVGGTSTGTFVDVAGNEGTYLERRID